MNRLDPIVAATREEVARRREAVPPAALERAMAARAEADGPLRSLPAAAYERGGAAALSILTEGPNFGGSVDDLRAARQATALPLLRKDFVVDPYQVQESFAAGADAILLIVAALSPGVLASLHAQASDLGLSALVEVHDERELDVVLELGAAIIGINNRDLKTLVVDTRRTFELLPRATGQALIVSESGFSRPEQLDELAEAGVDGVLVGEALMRSPDVEAACRVLTAR